MTIRDYIAEKVVNTATFVCVCGTRTGWYKGASKNKATRVCEHKKPDGTPCKISRRLLTATIDS